LICYGIGLAPSLTLCLLLAVNFGGDKDWRVRNDSRQSQDGPSQQQPRAVHQQKQVSQLSLSRRAFHLMILQAEITELSVVIPNLLRKSADSGLVSVNLVSFDETLRQLDNLTQGPLLTRGLVQSSTSVNDLFESASSD